MSLRARVVASAAAVLAVFILLTSLALERAFRETAESSREERLLAQIFLLMAAAEADSDGLVFPDALAEARFSLPGSGLYARVFDMSDRLVWESASAMGIPEPSPMDLVPGQRRLELRRGGDGEGYLVEGFGVSWETGELPRHYVFLVAEDMAAFNEEVGRFRGSLAVWLGAMALLMLTALVLILAWGLAPLRRVSTEVAAIESGNQAKILGTYPSEIRALTDNLNGLLAHEQARQRRLDNALGDLAHSLKTPLAVIRGAIGDAAGGADVGELMKEQLARMDNIIAHQLQRARTGGLLNTTLAPPVQIGRIADRLIASLGKVYRDKGVRATLEIPPETQLNGIEGDLLEMLGNLLDNAFKWCRKEVRIGAHRSKGLLVIAIEDDGPGIPPRDAERLLARGARADEAVPGHGIGLAVAREICEAYGGRLSVESSTLGGARICLNLPA
ncbi:ATP-binding protein [Thiocapsa roseopersicina]|uniref:histidine kinase n=1 Tax=Thiocapsa roseopersicina TaxID=1058 RepID=A0A1H2ZIM7_THIRO|nr:ATP-binding protein [Thiocapsa roseopersicina]SDX17225.1 two-component system, OmpR family, sensor histidine kinase PhoQ [Thiocapsa roseopersicina]